MRRRPIVAGIICAVVAASAVAGLQVASASSVSVGAGDLSTADIGHPCPGTATTTAAMPSGTSHTAVQVSLPTGCAGRQVSVTVLNGTTVVASGSQTVAASGPTVVGTGTYTASATLRVEAVVDGWPLPATWSYTPTVLPAVSCRIVNHPSATCSFEITSFTSWADPWPGINKFELNGRVVGEHNANGQVWELTFDFTNAQYPFVPRGLQSNGGLVLRSDCSQLPQMVARGNPNWAGPYDQIRAGQTRSVYLQGYLSSAGNLLTCP